MSIRRYYEERKLIAPEYGKEYENEGGGFFRCISRNNTAQQAILQNVDSGWTFAAHGIGQYPDGKIDWDFSTGGCFEEVDD